MILIDKNYKEFIETYNYYEGLVTKAFYSQEGFYKESHPIESIHFRDLEVFITYLNTEAFPNKSCLKVIYLNELLEYASK